MITTCNTAVTDTASEMHRKECCRKKPWVTRNLLDRWLLHSLKETYSSAGPKEPLASSVIQVKLCWKSSWTDLQPQNPTFNISRICTMSSYISKMHLTGYGMQPYGHHAEIQYQCKSSSRHWTSVRQCCSAVQINGSTGECSEQQLQSDKDVFFHPFSSTFFSKGLCLMLWRGWSGGAKVLCKLSVPGRHTNLDKSRARAYCTCSRCGRRLFRHFSLVYRFSFRSPFLGDGPI